MASTIAALTSGAGGISMTGDASGILNLNSNGTNVVAVTSAGVAVTGTLSATGAITGSSTVAGSTGILYPLTSGTAVASTSGTSIDFTSIPSWVKRITVMFAGVSTAGSGILIQIGAGSVTTSGYISTGNQYNQANGTNGISSTAGFAMFTSAADIISGIMTISALGSNIWVNSFAGKRTTTECISGGGNVTLGGTLDRVRFTTVNGTDAFDAGTVNLLYE